MFRIQSCLQQISQSACQQQVSGSKRVYIAANGIRLLSNRNLALELTKQLLLRPHASLPDDGVFYGFLPKFNKTVSFGSVKFFSHI